MGKGLLFNSPCGLYGGIMETPEDVERMIALHNCGWGSRRIAKELGVSRHTVRKYLKQGGWKPYKSPNRKSLLADKHEWLRERFFTHKGNADVILQELRQKHGIDVSLRTVERAVQPFRQELRARARATVRFETPPGRQMQIDFGSSLIQIGEEKVRVYLFVATLGYSRRGYVVPFLHERQSAWFKGMEEAFAHFGGTPEEILVDNAKPLVTKHNVATREVTFHDRFRAFASYWGFRPKACLPYRPRTKGKDESGVGYVKKNAIAGHRFHSWQDLEHHLQRWMHQVSDQRVHGTTGESPRQRFDSAEAFSLKPLEGKPPFLQIRELTRVVQSDASIEIDTNHYSVPWYLIGRTVLAQVTDRKVKISEGGAQICTHSEGQGRYKRIMDNRHLDGVVRVSQDYQSQGELLRPLAEYEAVMGGGWS